MHVPLHMLFIDPTVEGVAKMVGIHQEQGEDMLMQSTTARIRADALLQDGIAPEWLERT
jgi:hypothetical protein